MRAAAVGMATALLLGASGGVAVADGPKSDVGRCQIEFVCVSTGTEGKPETGQQTDAKPASGKKKPGLPPPCRVAKLDPQPPASSELWEGHDPSEGAIYTRICPGTAAAGIAGNLLPPEVFWAATAPPAVAVDPAQLAQEAVDKMQLRGPDIGITPKPGGKGVVGMPVWMWTTKSATTYGPNTASASAGGVTVTATAKVSKIVWDMGDGTTVTCGTAGTPYKAAYGKKDSPDCGHRYDQPSSTEPNDKFHVTATSTWTVDWQVNGSTGETGQLTEVRNSDVDITVAEVQVLN